MGCYQNISKYMLLAEYRIFSNITAAYKQKYKEVENVKSAQQGGTAIQNISF